MSDLGLEQQGVVSSLQHHAAPHFGSPPLPTQPRRQVTRGQASCETLSSRAVVSARGKHTLMPNYANIFVRRRDMHHSDTRFIAASPETSEAGQPTESPVSASWRAKVAPRPTNAITSISTTHTSQWWPATRSRSAGPEFAPPTRFQWIMCLGDSVTLRRRTSASQSHVRWDTLWTCAKD